jgi:hypothetical protein
MAVGWFKEGSGPRKGLSMSWNGAWSTVSTPAPRGAENGVTLSGISCTAANVCTAVGRTGGVSLVKAESTLAESWNGTSWAIQTTVNPLASVPSPAPLPAPARRSARSARKAKTPGR